MMRFLPVVALLQLPTTALAFEHEAILLEVRVGGEHIEQRGVAGGFVDGWGPTLVSGGALTQLISKQLSRSPGRSGGLLSRIQAAQQEIRAQKLFLFGNWRAIIKLLQPIRDDLRNYVGTLAADPDTRSAVFDAMILLARAHYGAQESERAIDIVNDMVRSFQDMEINEEVTRGPEFFKFYKSAEAGEARRPHYVLRLETDPPEKCNLYINEFRAGTGVKVERRVTAGRYRVFVRCPDGRTSRVYETNVDGNQAVTVNLRFDSALDATNDSVVLNFRNEAERAALEVAYASRIGHALDARRVVTLGLEIDVRTGAPRLVGRVIDPAREAQVSSHTITVAAGIAPPVGDARDLGNRLRLKQEEIVVATKTAPPPAAWKTPAETQTSARPDVATPAPLVQQAPAPGGRRHLPAWPGWVVAGLAAGGIAVGAYFLSVDGHQACQYPSFAPAATQCPTVYDTKGQGAAYTALGVGFLAAGLTWGIVSTVRSRKSAVR